MGDQINSVEDVYGHKLRVRVCGILIQDDSILMIKHRGLGVDGFLWTPPGGGMEFGVSAEKNLEREFKEETGLEIKVKNFLFLSEYMGPPLHAIELFFEVEPRSGKLFLGSDPELDGSNQIIEDVKYLKWKELKELKPTQLHHVFSSGTDMREIINYKGYFLFENNYIK